VVLAVAKQLGVSWHTIMRQVDQRSTPLIDDPDRLAGVSALGVEETAFLKATGCHPTLCATGIADLSPGRPARLLDVVPAAPARCSAGGWQTGTPSGVRRS